MSVSFEVSGIDKARMILDNIEKGIDKKHEELLHELGESIVYEARSNLQNNTNINSGHLLSSIKILKEDENSIWIGTDVDYAWYIEYGRGPVRPLKEGGWLHWIDKTSGKDVFAKFANATEPMPFLEPAVIKKSLDFPNMYAERVKDLL